MFWLFAAALAGCSGPIGVYHGLEGGAIAQSRQAPPGADLPYPNLADVPAAAPAIGPARSARIAAAAATGVSAPSSAALAGLALPVAAPPEPDVPGLNIPALPAAAPDVAPPPAPPARADGAPVAIAFAPGTALLPPDEAPALRAIATASAGATLRVGGFGEGSLTLALARAKRLADALTADGVAPAAIRVVAMQAGSGGFVQLVY